MRRAPLITALLLLLAVPSALASPAAKAEAALRSSFYLNTVPTLVEMMVEMHPGLLEALELAPAQRTLIGTAIIETWSEQRLYAHASALLQKKLSPKDLDAALAKMTPTVQRMFKAGISEPTPEEIREWAAKAEQHPDAKERAKLARRIAAHMPEPKGFMTLVGQFTEAVADVAQGATGTDELRGDLRTELSQALQPMADALADRENMTGATIAAYHAESTADMAALADALDSAASRKLQKAALECLIAGAERTRAELKARIERDLKSAKPSPAAAPR